MTNRTLKSGRLVPEAPQPVEVVLFTRCPAKWVSVDLETGDVWVFAETTWKRASDEAVAELSAMLDAKKNRHTP
jgi:uncharacterized protein (DUF2237 family)